MVSFWEEGEEEMGGREEEETEEEKGEVHLLRSASCCLHDF